MITTAHPLRGLPLAVIDTETTGLDEFDRVVEVSVVHTEIRPDAVPRVVLSERVDPSVPMSRRSTVITGIRDADLAGLPPLGAHESAIRAACEGRAVVAYNAPFDAAMLRRDGIDLGWPWIDLCVAAKAIDKYRAKLRDVARAYGIVLVDAHGAAADAAATALLARPLLRDLPGARNLETLGDLFVWQRAVALRQEAEFGAYLARTANAQRRAGATPPDFPWHEIEGEEPPPWRGPPAPEPTYEITTGGAVRRLDRPEPGAEG